MKWLPAIDQGWSHFPIIILQNSSSSPNSQGGLNFREFTVVGIVNDNNGGSSSAEKYERKQWQQLDNLPYN